MNAKAILVLGSAVAAAVAGNIGLALFLLMTGDYRDAFQAASWIHVNLLYVLPAMTSAALSGWLFCLGERYRRGRPLFVAGAICALGYAFNFFLMLFWLNAWLWLHGGTIASDVDVLDWKNPEVSMWWGILIAVFTIAFSIVPALLLELGVVLRARHRADGQVREAMA